MRTQETDAADSTSTAFDAF